MPDRASRPSTDRARGYLAPLCALTIAWLGTTPVLAEGPTRVEPTPAAPAAERPLDVRAALSTKAADGLKGQRVLRLLDIELDEHTPLAPQPTGPLGGDIIWVWIDMPTPRAASIEVRRMDRPVSRRTLTVEGLSPDVAARVVAIAASEMVRAQARPVRAKEPPKPAPEPANADEAAEQAFFGVTLSAALSTLVLPGSSPPLLYGPELALTHRQGPVGEQLYGRWLVNPGSEHEVRWFEIGAGADLRLALPDNDWRVHFGARAGAVTARLPGAAQIDGAPGDPQAWTARAGGLLGVERRLAGPSWLELAVEPGAVLHTIEASRADDRNGPGWSVGGFALDVSLAVNADAAFGSAAPRTRTQPPQPSAHLSGSGSAGQ
jgi:hypothetical protein